MEITFGSNSIVSAIRDSIDGTNRVVVTTVDGHEHDAFEPIAIGSDYISFYGTANKNPILIVPWPNIASIMFHK